MSKLPKWCLSLRTELRPTGDRIARLEALRAKYEILHDALVQVLSGCIGTSRLLQINLYRQSKSKWPNMSERDRLKGVFVDRAVEPEPNGYGMTREEFEKVMENINSLEDLCDYVAEREAQYPPWKPHLTELDSLAGMFEGVIPKTEFDWAHHRKNIERIRQDNVGDSIEAIMEEEARLALEEARLTAGAETQDSRILDDLRKVKWGLSKDKTKLLFSDKPSFGPHPSKNAIGFVDRQFDHAVVCYFRRSRSRERLSRVVIEVAPSSNDETTRERAKELKQSLVSEYGEPRHVVSESRESLSKLPEKDRLSKVVVWTPQDSVLTLGYGLQCDGVSEPFISIGYGHYLEDPFSRVWD